MTVVRDEHAFDLISHSPEQTRALGMHLGALVRAGDLICLQGELGSGKTCFVQGIGRGMGIEEIINSPSFTLVNEYAPAGSHLRLYHVDLYRLEHVIPEALAIGLDEYLLGDGVCVVEWADRAGALMPPNRLTITLRYIDQHKRGLLFESAGPRAFELLTAFRKRVWPESKPLSP